MQQITTQLVLAVTQATVNASNETQLRHQIEKELEIACKALGITWSSYQLDRTLKLGGNKHKFVDVAHGAVLVEYEPPNSFSGIAGSVLAHAKSQVEEYLRLIAVEEGRDKSEYVMVVWDGASIAYGRTAEDGYKWEALRPFDHVTAVRLLQELKNNGRPLIHPKLLLELLGPESSLGISLIPKLFASTVAAEHSTKTTKTRLLYMEWRRLFSQTTGIQTDKLRDYIEQQQHLHQQTYKKAPTAFLFALYSYIALLAKLIAASALHFSTQNILDNSVPLRQRLRALESGKLFEDAGVTNMLSGDFFSWYVDDVQWEQFGPDLEGIIERLASVNYDIAKKTASSVRDLFKGIYETLIPRALRHALGEFYTPDWLAEHGLDMVGWQSGDTLLDPTCGTGTFMLEALRRRIAVGYGETAHKLLSGIYGLDLNPLAVLAAKSSLVVVLAQELQPDNPLQLPVYLADAINPARPDRDGLYRSSLQTEHGIKTFSVPEKLIRSKNFYQIFNRIRELIDSGMKPERILEVIEGDIKDLDLSQPEVDAVQRTVATLCDLNRVGWDGIWCSILADRFSGAAIGPVSHICGNPPWIKWSNLPPEYAKLIKPRCLELGLFSSDRWVGGIESDISTIVTFEAIVNFLAQDGRLAFFITGTVFKNESSEGFRQFRLDHGRLVCRVERVEDFADLAPFDGVNNYPTLIVLTRDQQTDFPLLWRRWNAPVGESHTTISFFDARQFRQNTTYTDLWALPVPGQGCRPWLVATAEQHKKIKNAFATSNPHYVARKGVCTDRNGIYWVYTLSASETDVTIRNASSIGRTKGIPEVQMRIEKKHVYPLLRGRNVRPFSATVDPELSIVVPQPHMYGDPDLPAHSPKTFRFLSNFKDTLLKRSSYKRYQDGHPFYSLWNVGRYTFSPFKVLWREMGGGKFSAAYIGSYEHPVLGRKIVIPDHKLYFISVETEDEAAYLTTMLNSALISGATSAYAAQLSLGASVAEYLHLPQFDESNAIQMRLAELGKRMTADNSSFMLDKVRQEVNQLVRDLLNSDTVYSNNTIDIA